MLVVGLASGAVEETPLEGVGGGGGVPGSEPGTERGEQGLGQDAEHDVQVDVEVDGRRQGVGAERKARTMKHIVGTALAAVTTLVLLGACVALLAGKDDIRKFHRMRSM